MTRKPKVESTVKKMEKPLQPPLNKKIHAPKRRTLSKPVKPTKSATVTRPRSPSPFGEDPQIILTDVEFNSPVKIVQGDPEYVESIESLTKKARKEASTPEMSPAVHVTPVLKIAIPTEEEVAMAADVLQNIVESMTSVHHVEPEGLPVTGYNTSSTATPENIVEDSRIVVKQSKEKEVCKNVEIETEGASANMKVATKNENKENDSVKNNEKTETQSTEKDSEVEIENTEREIEIKEARKTLRNEDNVEQKEESTENVEMKVENHEKENDEEKLKKEKKEKKANRKHKQKDEIIILNEDEINVQEEVVKDSEELTSEELLRKQEKILRREERKRKREEKRIENERNIKRAKEERMMDEEIRNIVRESESENENDPIITRKDLELERKQNDVGFTLEDRITLDVGGRHFATTRMTLMKDGNSKLYSLAKRGQKHYFIDRDGAHFRYILNFLREDCNISMDVLPRENRYLLELKYECIYYNLDGLRRLVEARLDTYASLGLAF